MISIDRLEEMAIEEFETKLNSWKEQVELQSNFIDSLLKATNNSEWLDKTILDDEASEIIEKIELDYVQLDQLKAENEELKKQLMQKSEVDMFFNTPIEGWSSDPCGVCKYKNCLTEIKEIAEQASEDYRMPEEEWNKILQKISECEGNYD